MPRLLIVDDEEDVREFAANFFRKRKLDVITASSGEGALSISENNKPDLILVDWDLPGLQEDGLIAQIRQACPQTHIIALSERQELRRSALSVVDDFASKTYPPEGLLSIIDAYQLRISGLKASGPQVACL